MLDFAGSVWEQDGALDGRVRARSWPKWGWERPWVVSGLLYPSLHSDITAGYVSWAPLTDDLHEDIGSTLLQQGAACGWGLGSPLQALFQVHQVSVLSQEGNGRWEGREGGKAKLVLLPGTLGIPTP